MALDLIDLLKLIGILTAVYLLLYLLVRLIRGNSLLRSKILIDSGETQADQMYYLPGYRLTLMAKAKVLIKKTGGKIQDTPQLLELSISPQTTIEADTNQLIALDYRGDIFSSDEIRITVSAGSLLENIYASTDDRVDEIVTRLANVPADIVSETQARAFAKDIGTSYEVREVSRVFETSSKETATDGKIKRDWKITIENKELNVSFDLKNISHRKQLPLTDRKTYDGILTRPLVRQNWEFSLQGGAQKVMAFTCMMPDQSRLVCVPVRRSWLVKKLQLPKLSNGLLVENYIQKPSEAEAFVSIPIAIGKALVSIPAQLLRFRITHDKLKTEEENAELELLKARKARADLDIKNLSEEVSRLKEKLRSEGGEAEQAPGEDGQERIPKLGKGPATEPQQDKSIRDFIKENNSRIKNLANNAILPAHSWAQKFSGPWPVYDNKEINDCVPAAAAHMVTCWTSNTRPAPNILTRDTVVQTFTNSGACLNSGCNIGDFLQQWRRTGFGNTRIKASGHLLTAEEEELKTAIYYFGPCIVGLQMPLMARDQKEGRWFIDENAPAASKAKGSWSEQAGHAVCAIGYDEKGITAISWGEAVYIEWPFYKAYNDETYVALSDDWLITGGVTPAPASKNQSELESIINHLNA
jgi:hypothetical protein